METWTVSSYLVIMNNVSMDICIVCVCLPYDVWEVLEQEQIKQRY